MTLKKEVPGVGAVRHWLYLAAKALRVSPTSRCLVLSPHWVVVPFLGNVKPLGLDICGSVDCPGTCSPNTRSPRVQLLGARACPDMGFEVGL
jgi:hypothetical protein